MQRSLIRVAGYALLLAIGVMLGAFYSERQYRKATTTPLFERDYVKAGACPSHTLRRINQVLDTDNTAVPTPLRRELEAERRALVSEICPQSRQ